MCSEGEVMAALPAHFVTANHTGISTNRRRFQSAGSRRIPVAEALLLKGANFAEVQQCLILARNLVKRLIEKKVCFVWESLKESYSPRKETYVLLNPLYEAEENLARLLNEDKKLQRAGKQMELLLAYLHFMKTEGEVTKAALLKKSNATDAQLKGP
jgi:primosomal protein N' (replication factor Y)